LGKLLPEPELAGLKNLVRGHECIVLGSGPSLEIDLERLKRADFLDKTIITADGATSAVLKFRNPGIIVTDLDGNVGDQLDAWRLGSWVVVHAHGDNIAQVRKIAPKLKERVIGTTQVEPFGKLYNFGGFTDGDRAAFMAHELGASKIYLAGMDLGMRIGKHSGDKDLSRKLIKLKICKELLAWLAGELGANIVNLTTHGESIPNVPTTVVS
ncbi:MAG: DUF115 domain-containing protein, partial [Candidatus Hadarchaeum sp.]|nr:DUF115 domain-containing protein [Candidatus Hadarchaeum sp.]